MVYLESTHVRIGADFIAILGFLFVFFTVFCALWGLRGARKRIISGIDRGRLSRRGIGNGWLRIGTCANGTRLYLNFGLFVRFFWRYFGLGAGELRGARKKVISGIDRARLARPGIGNCWLGIGTCANWTRVYLNVSVFWSFFLWYFGEQGRQGGVRKKTISGIDRAGLALLGIGNGWLGIDTCGNRTWKYSNRPQKYPT